jgi:DNA-binding NtrC family response regulator
MLILDEFSSPVSLILHLEAEGYEVILAQNERQLQDKLVNGSKPDLIFLEMQLNAIEMLQLIQSMQPQIPVILMAEPSLGNLALEVKEEFGTWEVLIKPIDFRLLRAQVQQAMQSRLLAVEGDGQIQEMVSQEFPMPPSAAPLSMRMGFPSIGGVSGWVVPNRRTHP